MLDAPRAPVCVCGNSTKHVERGATVWCAMCGSIRVLFQDYFEVPISRARDLPHSPIVDVPTTGIVLRPGAIEADDEEPTRPHTPVSKKVRE
jgi:hypothetical protein